jgi:Ribbon-helix-helix protein, copG family
MRKTKLTSIRLTEDAKLLIELLSKKLGVSQSALLELALRALAKQEKISGDQETQEVRR